MSNLVAAMYADLGAPLSSTVFATDAMGENTVDQGGFGIVASTTPPEVAIRCFEEGLQPGFSVCRLNGSFKGMSATHSRIGANIPFTRVPAELLSCD